MWFDNRKKNVDVSYFSTCVQSNLCCARGCAFIDQKRLFCYG